MYCFFHNCMWQSSYSGINLVLLNLHRSLRSCKIFNFCRCQHATFCGFWSTYGSDNWVFGFGWVRWVSLLLLAISESTSPIQWSLKEIVGGGRGDTYLLVNDFFRFHHNYIRDNKLGVYRKRWLRYILFERISILSVGQAENRPNTPYLGAFSTFACTMQDVVWSNHALADPCDPHSWDSQP